MYNSDGHGHIIDISAVSDDTQQVRQKIYDKFLIPKEEQSSYQLYIQVSQVKTDECS